MSEQARFRFGPLERRGLLLGLRGAQLGVLLGGVVVALSVVHSAPPEVAVFLAGGILVLTVIVGFIPFGGRTPEQWSPVAATYLYRRFQKEHHFVSSAPLTGHTRTAGPDADLPTALKGVSILAAPVVGGDLGVLKDALTGAYSSVLSVRGRSFALLDNDAKQRLLGQWADVLSGLAREGSPVRRIQWVERTVPDPGDGIGQYLRDAIALPHTSAAVRSYLQLVEDAGPATQHHEVFVVIQIDQARARRMIKQSGGGDQGACAVLARETFALAQRLQGAELDVVGMLTPRLLAQTMRVSFDPASRTAIAIRNITDRTNAGLDADQAWPMAADTTWTHFRTDSSYHVTYWIAEWPRTDVGPDFMAPLLMQAWVNRTVSVTMEPVPPLKAQREVEYARTSDVAEATLRQKHGFLTTMRRQREQESVMRREQELADGHADIRFSGYITVSGANPEELEIACSEMEQLAGQSRLVLRRLYGEQDLGFTFTLPLARGLRSR